MLGQEKRKTLRRPTGASTGPCTSGKDTLCVGRDPDDVSAGLRKRERKGGGTQTPRRVDAPPGQVVLYVGTTQVRNRSGQDCRTGYPLAGQGTGGCGIVNPEQRDYALNGGSPDKESRKKEKQLRKPQDFFRCACTNKDWQHPAVPQSTLRAHARTMGHIRTSRARRYVRVRRRR